MLSITPILIKNSTATDQKLLLSINLLFLDLYPALCIFSPSLSGKPGLRNSSGTVQTTFGLRYRSCTVPPFWHDELVPDFRPFQDDVQHHTVALLHRTSRTDDINMELLMLSSCFLPAPALEDVLEQHRSYIPWYSIHTLGELTSKCLYEYSRLVAVLAGVKAVLGQVKSGIAK